jgi:hypothetical protein
VTKPNINFEDNYIEPLEPIGLGEGKHNVSCRTLTTLEKVMFAQDDYGIAKYKKPLKHQMEYGWLEMFLEEMADGLKYIQNEMDRKHLITELLESALESDDPKPIMKTAIRLLKMNGTGK